MSDEKFTQGEWVSDGCFVEGQNGEGIVSGVFVTSDEELKANADLISAAPDMYREIRNDIKRLERQAKECVIGSHQLMAINSQLSRKRTIIAKADGEQTND